LALKTSVFILVLTENQRALMNVYLAVCFKSCD